MDMADSMHYETRQIREALQASNARLRSARYARPTSSLTPQQGAAMLQDWEGLSSTGDIDNNTTAASQNPVYQQMRSALLAFESEVGYAAPARERAFFSALRTQLMEAASCREPEQRDMQLAATYKWFSKHKPQGPEVDPITAAVLASSLSVEAAGDGRASQQGFGGALPPASMQQRLNAAHSAALGSGGGGYGGAGSGAQAGPQGKHQFFGVFSGTTGGAAGGGSGGGAGPGPSSAYLAGSTRQGSARGPSPTAAAGSRPGAGGAGSLSLNHPLVMHPTVAHGATGGGVGAGASARGGPAGPSGTNGSGGPGRARFASTDMYAPGKLVRTQELDELDHRAAAAAAAAAEGGRAGVLRHPKPWMTGPFKANAGTRGAGGGAGPCAPGKTAAEEQELAALREKWTAMDSKTSASVADVQAKVAEWTLQRARLEEEIVRRQEANRFAKPGAAGSAGGSAPWQQPPGMRKPGDADHGLPAGTLSPYANANADLAAATAAAAASSSAAVPSSVSFLLPGGGSGGASSSAAVAGANMRLRHAEVASYDRGRADLVARLAALGVGVNSDTLDRALRPVEDRPFLDCISRLPKPGDHLPSRPGSVRLPAAKKKKRSKSAGKSRPKSGR
ncbi:hypothetical protein HYH02_009059 [Chlamydomonas schloesseri]|uniref:Uncharacterized protein n=1 Tax=Chlamydomonas schloesseri TaxID=2026947 RepID=A0A835WB75_9CHLO|nr:hypothetical protein HYH02_009059 [Chlamydomonas schloesseri]|eukprot:KAG2444118.1 hypothetical protein HYH02_009059 [Chlamydomonas schloesseri]